MEKIKIIIADDKEKYRALIKEMLEPSQVSVIGEADQGQRLLTLLNKKSPDIVLLDLEMPVMDGNKAFEIICKKFPAIKVIVLSYYYESVLVENYLERGAKGYIPKEALDPDLLINALTQVMDGGVFFYEKPVAKKKFTPRQKEIMSLIFEGLTNDQISEEIQISKRAVEKQRHRIYQKSGAEKIVDFYKYAFTKGLQFLGKYKKRHDKPVT